jgi:hypothetical protein
MAAGNAVIGALSVVLGVDTATFETGLKSAATRLGVFAGVGIAAGEAMGRALGGALRDLALAIPKTIDQFDNLSKTSQKIGVPVEQLTALQHAADLSDVSAETLTKALGKLAKSTLDAAQGSTTAVAAYQALGISFQDSTGHMKSVGDLLPQIADKFAMMKDGTAKTALAMQIFGRAGADLIPLLNGGSAGLKEMTDEARQLGLIISGDTAVTAENFNDNLTRLKDVLRGVVVQLTANILPALAQFSQFLIDGAKNSGFLQAATDVLTTAFNGFARAVIVIYDNIKPLGQLLALWVSSGLLVSVGSAAISLGLAFVKLITVTRTLGLTMAAFEVIRSISWRGILLIAGAVAIATGAFEGFGEKLEALGGKLAKWLPEGATENAKKILEALGLNLKGLETDLKSWQATAAKNGGGLFDPNIIKTTKDALDSFIASKEKVIATNNAEAATIGMSNVAMTQAKVVAEGLAIAQANHIPITEKLTTALQNLGLRLGQSNEQAQFGAQIWEQTRTPLEQFQQAMERLNATGWDKTNPDLYARAVAQAQDKMVQASPYAQALGNSLTTAFDSAIQRGAKLSDVLKQLLADLSRALANAAFKQLLFGNASQGGSFSGILGGLFSSLPKFASGGSILPGGGSGVDSQLVAFWKSPGERVDIGTPGQLDSGYGGASFVYSPVIDARGADAAAVARLAQVVAADKRTFDQRVRATVSSWRSNTPSALKA